MFQFVAVWGNHSVPLEPSFVDLPFTSVVKVFVGNATKLKIILNTKTSQKEIDEFNVEPFNVNRIQLELSTAKETRGYRVVTKLIDKTKIPLTVFEFTPNSRLLVHSQYDYTGATDFPAYVSFKKGILQVGAAARLMQQMYPEMVVFDIPRLLTPNSKPNPSWAFATNRDADGKVRIDMGDSCSTYPEVCLGIVIKSVLKHVQEHFKQNIVDAIGVKLPMGATVSQSMCNALSEQVGVRLCFVSCQ